MMNDLFDGFGNNSGTIMVRVTVAGRSQPRPQAGVVALYPTGNAGLPLNSVVRFAWKPYSGAVNYVFRLWLVKQSGIVRNDPQSHLNVTKVLYNSTAFAWNDQGFLPGVYQYDILPIDSMGNALAAWSAPVTINLYK